MKHCLKLCVIRRVLRDIKVSLFESENFRFLFSNCFRSFFRDKNEHLLPPAPAFCEIKIYLQNYSKGKNCKDPATCTMYICMFVCNCNGYGICFRPQKYLSKHFHILSFPIVNVHTTYGHLQNA